MGQTNADSATNSAHMPLSKKQLIFVFISFWLHITLLDLVFINFKGPVFLWQDSFQPLTVLTHTAIALLATLTVFASHRLLSKLKQNPSVSETVWAICSLLLILSIGIVIY